MHPLEKVAGSLGRGGEDFPSAADDVTALRVAPWRHGKPVVSPAAPVRRPDGHVSPPLAALAARHMKACGGYGQASQASKATFRANAAMPRVFRTEKEE